MSIPATFAASSVASRETDSWNNQAGRIKNDAAGHITPRQSGSNMYFYHVHLSDVTSSCCSDPPLASLKKGSTSPERIIAWCSQITADGDELAQDPSVDI